MENAQISNEIQNELKGVGGWLKFFVVVRIYLSPILSSIMLIVAWIAIGHITDEHPGAALSMLVETAVGVGLIIWGVQVGIALRDIQPQAVQKTKSFLKFVLLWSIVSPFISLISGLDSETVIAEGVKDFFKPIVSFAIWYSYFSNSKRVKATYPDATSTVTEATTAPAV